MEEVLRRWLTVNCLFFFLQEREMKLQQEGAGIKMDSVLPHLVLVDDDLLSTGIVVYHLKVVQLALNRWFFFIISLAVQFHEIFVCNTQPREDHWKFQENGRGTCRLWERECTHEGYNV